MMSARNYSISPDGRRLAVLQNEDLQLFDLPQSSQDEQTKFAELKSDLPDFYSISSDPDSTPLSAERMSALPAASTNAPDDNSANTPAPSTPTGASPDPSSASDSEPVATIRVSTKSVLVDVVVTDSKGHPIPDLRQEGFQIFEDGHPQEVGSFRAFSGGEPKGHTSSTNSSPVAKLEAPSPNVFTNQTHGPETGAVTLVLFDMLNTPIQDQAYAGQRLVKFIQAKPKNMQLALCTMSLGTNTHLRLIQGFSPSEKVLLAAANAKKATPKETRWQVSSSGNLNNVNTVGDLAQGGPTSGFQGLLSALQQGQAVEQVSDTEERSAITLESMMLLARYLSGIRGRKNIVWLSGSFPISLAATTNNNNIALENPNYTAKIKRVTNLMAEAQIAVYPVDVRGLIGAGQSAAGAGGMGGPSFTGSQDFSGGNMISPRPSIPSDMQALAQEAAERDTLLQFATATGGRAFFNTNGIRDAIANAAEQGSNYYTLSYNPTNKNFDGKFRKIGVQLAQKGSSLHYRQGYYADDLRSSARETELARRASVVAMQHGTPLSHQILFSVRVYPVGSKTKMETAKIGGIVAAPSRKAAQNATPSALVEVQHYIVDYTINGSELRFLPLENSKYRNTHPDGNLVQS
jgi:VWFA-related protein